MSDQQFDIIFRGDIVFGHQLADVKTRLQQLFKADATKIDALFSGRPVPLKRGLDEASAQKYKEALVRAGAQVDIVVMGETRPAKPQPAPVVPVTSLTLAQRLEKQEAIAKAEAEAAAAQEAIRREQAEREAEQSGIPIKPVWSLAPVGSYLLQPTEKTIQEPLDIDTSAISLRPEGGNLVDAAEKPPIAVAAVTVPNFQVAEVGADLVSADEKMDLPLLEIELADWTLADLGQDLIAASEKAAVNIPVIHIPDVGLAPVGADLGQLKPQVQAVVPDVSGLRLAD